MLTPIRLRVRVRVRGLGLRSVVGLMLHRVGLGFVLGLAFDSGLGLGVEKHGTVL